MTKKIKTYMLLLRPHQWMKNLLLLFPPFFGGKIFDPAVLVTIIPALVSFSLAASCGYILNDIKDRKSDKHHSSKRERPLVNGDVSIAAAIIVSIVLYIVAMLVSASVSPRFEACMIIYLLLSLLYTYYFKDLVIMDIFFIAFGFLIRIMAGGEAFQITVSGWLFLTVFIVALFLATGKRLGEVLTLGIDSSLHRKVLAQYSESFLEGTMWFSASSAILMYALYTIENKNAMLYTVPLAAFGLLRYIYVVKQGRGDPTEVLLRDPQISAVGLIWLIVIALIKYR